MSLFKYTDDKSELKIMQTENIPVRQVIQFQLPLLKEITEFGKNTKQYN